MPTTTEMCVRATLSGKRMLELGCQPLSCTVLEAGGLPNNQVIKDCIAVHLANWVSEFGVCPRVPNGCYNN